MGGGQYCPPGRKSPVIGKKNKNFQKWTVGPYFCFPWEERNVSLLFAEKMREKNYTPQYFNQSQMARISNVSCSLYACARREDFAVECRPTFETNSKLHVGIEIAGFGSFWGRQYGGAVVPRILPKSPLAGCRLSLSEVQWLMTIGEVACLGMCRAVP